MQKGSIHLTRLSADPERYLVTFQVMDGTIGGPLDRTFPGLGSLGTFLRQVDIPHDRIKTALRDARRGKAAKIPDVVLCDHELEDFVCATAETSPRASVAGPRGRVVVSGSFHRTDTRT